MIRTIEQAKSFRTTIESAAEKLEDNEASLAVDLFSRLKYDGSLISAGTRINWRGALKRAAVDLWSKEENNPDNAANLWEDIAYRDGYRIIPQTITSGVLFSKGEIGWWKDNIYESIINNNIWNPSDYPDGWRIVND